MRVKSVPPAVLAAMGVKRPSTLVLHDREAELEITRERFVADTRNGRRALLLAERRAAMKGQRGAGPQRPLPARYRRMKLAKPVVYPKGAEASLNALRGPEIDGARLVTSKTPIVDHRLIRDPRTHAQHKAARKAASRGLFVGFVAVENAA